MPPKKKAKSKADDWLQCSLCDQVVSQADAEAHSASCSQSEHGYILDRVLHGKLIAAEKLLEDDGSPVTKSVRDFNNTVWLSIPAMQMCGLSIGQPCVVNRVLVLRAWPAKMPSPTAVAMTTSELDLINACLGSFITVERLHSSEETAVSVKVNVRQPNKLFETEEFSSYTSACLDGKFITVDTPLRINYFGQICLCHVQQITTENRDHDLDLSPQCSTSPTSRENEPSTPLKNSDSIVNSSLNISFDSAPSEHVTPNSNTNNAKQSSSDELSESMSSLNISNLSQSFTSTPDVHKREMYPNMVTPVKHSSTNVKPHHKPFVKVNSSTRFSVVSQHCAEGESQGQTGEKLSLKDLGGLTVQIEELKSRIRRGLQPSSSSRCILLYGPAGVGKTMLAKALTAELGLHTVYVAGTDIWSKLFGEAESNLKKLFKIAKDRSPSVLVIDDLDVLCPKHSQTGQQVHRILGTLVSLLDGCCTDRSRPVAVLGITNSKDSVDPALLRAGRFGCEVELSVPTAQQRLQILQVLLAKVSHSLSDSEMQTISKNAHGYVGADLAALVNEACMHTTKDNSDHPEPLTMADFVYAGLQIKPSALREIQLDIPEVRWSDIGGMSEVKMRLREAVELPLSHPEVYEGLGIEPPRGLLMYGPPGCSKTMVARALATECHLNFLAVKGPELFNQYVGESEKAIREVFRKARSAAPSVVFFDEIDAIAGKRGGSGSSGVDDRVLTQLLTEMDGMETLKDVFVMAATNRPDKMDRALLRPGRFDSLIYVPLPDSDTRREILEKKFAKMAVGEDIDISTLVQQTHNYSGAELIQVCQEAAMFALRESLTAHQVHRRHFDQALDKVQPQIDPELLEVYTQFSRTKL